ncbi:MAG: sensor histidine kinase, partial [Deferrisomatales bacterium]
MTEPLVPFRFDRDPRLAELLDPGKAERWARQAVSSLRVGLAVADRDGAVLAAALPAEGAGAAAARQALERAAAGAAADLGRLEDGRPVALAAGPYRWVAAALRVGGEALGLLLLGPRVEGDPTAGALARVGEGTLRALIGPLRDSLEWVLRAEHARLMVSDLHLEAVEAGHRELMEANLRLRESEHRLQGVVEDLTRGVQEAAEEATRAQRDAYRHERQASLGRLAAGVAHEINNPLAFVTSSLAAARRYLDDLRPLLEAARRLSDAPGALPEPAATVARAARDAELGVLLQDFGDLLGEAREGTRRVARLGQVLG